MRKILALVVTLLFLVSMTAVSFAADKMATMTIAQAGELAVGTDEPMADEAKPKKTKKAKKAKKTKKAKKDKADAAPAAPAAPAAAPAH